MAALSEVQGPSYIEQGRAGKGALCCVRALRKGTKCITVIPMEDNTGIGISDRIAKVYEINLVRCMFCGFCEDACPTTAIRMGRDYELACFSLDCTLAVKERLLEPREIPVDFDGGYVVKAKLEKTKEGLKVMADLTKKKRWW